MIHTYTFSRLPALLAIIDRKIQPLAGCVVLQTSPIQYELDRRFLILFFSGFFCFFLEWVSVGFFFMLSQRFLGVFFLP